MAQTNQHDQEAERREKLLAQQQQLTKRYREEDTAAGAKIEKLEAPLIAARRERFKLSREYRDAMRELQQEQEQCERELRESVSPEIAAVLNQADELERKALRSGAHQAGDDCPVNRIRQLRREIEQLTLEPSGRISKRLAELRAQLPSEAEARSSWPVVTLEEKQKDKESLMGAMWGSKRRNPLNEAQR